MHDAANTAHIHELLMNTSEARSSCQLCHLFGLKESLGLDFELVQSLRFAWGK
jgi:hypothetical protein